MVLFDLTAKDIPESMTRLPTHKARIREINFSSDGRWLLTANSSEARVFDLYKLFGTPDQE
ncbi:hypothetical protein Poly41_28070 [Novipirellula artificiosorum]|uniref:WD domain, G-beta repeat n=1 Tax=Novipirellula artificiosorum TaxID=2528016 RepID=A0A5C6DS62_9BACT|nr:hypothetical protein Poly41_28070 [Novipirellula artificiosorum]